MIDRRSRSWRNGSAVKDMLTFVIDRRSRSWRNGSAVKSMLILQRFGSHHLAQVTVAHNCLQLDPTDLTLSSDFLGNLHTCDAYTYMHKHTYIHRLSQSLQKEGRDVLMYTGKDFDFRALTSGFFKVCAQRSLHKSTG